MIMKTFQMTITKDSPNADKLYFVILGFFITKGQKIEKKG